MQKVEEKKDKKLQKNSESTLTKVFIPKSFPLHKRDELMIYNIYIQDRGDGVQRSKIMRYPCVRQGCMTTCYFDAKSNSSLNTDEHNFCLNCGNKNQSRIYLDIGLKVFLQKHHKYITLNQPFNVQINPFKKEHAFPPSSLNNHISTHLSSYISHKLFQELRLKEAAINNRIIDFNRVRNDLQILITPKQQKKNYFLYSFCKYYHQPNQKPNKLYIMIWLYGEKQSFKVRILRQNNKQMCEAKDYLEYGMVNFIVSINTLIFAIPKNGATQYFVSKVDHHFLKEQMVIKVVEMEGWKDPQSRIYGSMIIDQNTNSIFVIGGIDRVKNDCLQYISCFTKCRWQKVEKLELIAVIQKNHKLFEGTNIYSSLNTKNSINKNQPYQNKFAFIKNLFMIYYYNRKIISENNNKFLQGIIPLKKQFFSIGGAVKDPTYTSNRLKNQKSGIRFIKYDTSSKQNPIINENINNISFSGNSYFSFQIPYNPALSLRKFRSNIVVFGGHRGEGSMADFRNRNGQKQDPYQLDPFFQNIYLVDMTDLKYSKIIDQKFKYSRFLPQNLDQFSILLQDQMNKFYVRATLPLEKPIQIEDGFIQYIVLQFWLENSMFYFIPISSPKIKNQQNLY